MYYENDYYDEEYDGQGLRENIKALYYGRNDYQPRMRDLLRKYGNERILSMTINRNPIKNVERFFNIISLGKFQQELNKTPYDKLFHLSLILHTNKGNFILEKNEVLNLVKTDNIPENSTQLSINEKLDITINELLNNTHKKMGNKFFPYHHSNNNCQDFILNVLHSNGIINQTFDDFIKQDLRKITNKHPILNKIIHSLTNLAEKTNILTEGAGLNMQSKELELKKYSNPKIVKQQMKKYKIPETLYISTRKDKKYMIIHNNKKIHFGQMGYKDFTITRNLEKQNNFRLRNSKWANAEKYSPAWLSYYLLW